MLSFLPLERYRKIPQFVWFTLQTQRQLARSKGLLGYAMDADLLRHNFWTLSVWEDRESLQNFVDEIPHSKIMHSLAPHMGKTQFVEWKVTAQEIPLGWDAAKARLR